MIVGAPERSPLTKSAYVSMRKAGIIIDVKPGGTAGVSTLVPADSKG